MKTVLLILNMRDMLILQVSKWKSIAIFERAVCKSVVEVLIFTVRSFFFSSLLLLLFVFESTRLNSCVYFFLILCVCVINYLLDMMVHTWKPSNAKAKAGGLSRIQDQLGYLVSLWPVWATERDSLSKKKKERSKTK